MTTEIPTNSPRRHPIRVGALIWGLVVIVVAVLIILTRYSGIPLDPRLVLIGTLFGTGLALLLGGILSNLAKARTRAEISTPPSDDAQEG